MSQSIVLVLLATLAAPGCSCDGGGGTVQPDAGTSDAMPDADVDTLEDCAAGDESFVRNAYLAILGHRPLSQAEVDVYRDLLVETRALAEAGTLDADPHEVVARALMANEGYAERWADIVMDALRVTRIEGQSMESCYGRTSRSDHDGSLAMHVRETPGTGTGDGNGRFTMRDLLLSSIELDDISPIYRGHLYALVSRAIPAANVPRVQAELARREDFGLVFDSAYLNRDIVCLGCHNTEFSVTESPDPQSNRHWPLAGMVEKSLYGDSRGIEVERAHAPFRYDGFVANIDGGDSGDAQPWDWSPACGGFYPAGLEPDPADIDGLFGSLSGKKLTVYDLEAALGRGFETIRGNGLAIGAEGEVADPDAAFAYMVATAFVEAVWIEIIGSPLTIANYFPRNQAARDQLQTLTDSFVASGFSLRTLLVDIVRSDYFNRLDPAAGCGVEPYSAPAIYDPWVTTDDDPARRGNGPGDAVAALSGRTLLRAAYEALQWPAPRFQTFPEVPFEVNFCENFSCGAMESFCQSQGFCCVSYELLCAEPPGENEPSSSEERNFQRGIGVFLKNGERGFRGLDFQARLVWEDRFGACLEPYPETDDFVDGVVAAALTSDASVRDVVAALKDRLIGESDIRDEVELGAIEALFGVAIDTPVGDVPDLGDSARRFCGVILSTPQFLLSGFAGRGGAVPTLTPEVASYGTVCSQLAAEELTAVQVSCESETLSVMAR